MSMERVFGYVRVSTETQEKKGYGLQAQEKAIKEYCKKNDLELVQIFRDEGVSGKNLDRPGLADLLVNLTTIKKVVVLNTSRLWRNNIALGFIQWELNKLGVDVLSVEQSGYSIYDEAQDPETFLKNGIFELLDQYDRKLIVRKLASGRRTKAREGHKAGGIAPCGYKWQYSVGGKPEIAIDEEKAPDIKLMFAKYLELGSIHAVTKFITEKGLKSPRGKQFAVETVRKILSNDFYIGVVRHAGERIKGKHTPIISPIVFGKVRKQLERNAKNYSKQSA